MNELTPRSPNRTCKQIVAFFPTVEQAFAFTNAKWSSSNFDLSLLSLTMNFYSIYVSKFKLDKFCQVQSSIKYKVTPDGSEGICVVQLGETCSDHISYELWCLLCLNYFQGQDRFRKIVGIDAAVDCIKMKKGINWELRSLLLGYWRKKLRRIGARIRFRRTFY